jgi:hypothetical protein
MMREIFQNDAGAFSTRYGSLFNEMGESFQNDTGGFSK